MFEMSTASDPNEVDDQVVKVDTFLSESFDLRVRMKDGFSEQYDELYALKFEKWACDLHTKMKNLRALKNKILTQKDECQRRSIQAAELDKQLASAENLSCEIDLRCNSLLYKYDVIFEDLTDYQILEMSKDKKLDEEFNAILDKVTSLASLMSFGEQGMKKSVEDSIEKRNELAKIGAIRKSIDETILKRNNLAKCRKQFVTSLQKVLKERDISDGKLKNASALKIDLPKFFGYDFKMDFYTFKVSEVFR